MSALTNHAQNHLSGLAADSEDLTVLGESSPVLATPAAAAAAVGAGAAVTAAGIAGFVAEEAADG